jgi:hypothetical protein
LITKDAEKALNEAGIPLAFGSRIKQLQDTALPGGVGMEELARESVSAATFVEALRTRFS